MSRVYVMLTVLALGGAMVGCGRNAGLAPGAVEPVAGAVAVRVVNNNFNDMDVYAMSGGVARRLGTVTAASNGTFVLDPSYFPTGDLRLVATPIGGRGRAFSGPLNVTVGETVEFDIAPQLGDSMAVVR